MLPKEVTKNNYAPYFTQTTTKQQKKNYFKYKWEDYSKNKETPKKNPVVAATHRTVEVQVDK